jgi:MFS family permease
VLRHAGEVPVSLANYRAALSAPGARLPALASAVGRLGIAMIGLATLLYVQRSTGSFAIAGLVSAGGLIGVSVGSVAQGRLIDRLGPTRPLVIISIAYAAATAAVVLAVEAGMPVPVLVGASLLAGMFGPALPGASRALWSDLVPAGRQLEAAYNYEAISFEVFFVLGPAIAAFLVAAPWPGTGPVVAATCIVVGAAAFALTRAARARLPKSSGAERPHVGILGALSRPGLRTVVLASLGFGIVIGTVEVGVPAVTTAGGSRLLGGLLLSAWSMAGVLAGLLYGVRPWPRSLHLRIPALLGGFAIMVTTMAATGPTGSLIVLVLALLGAGCLLTPQVVAHSLAVDRVAPAESATEAFGWVITAATLGLATGQSAAGVAAETAGPPAAFVVGGAAGLVIAAVLWLRRRTLLAPSDRPPVYQMPEAVSQ